MRIKTHASCMTECVHNFQFSNDVMPVGVMEAPRSSPLRAVSRVERKTHNVPACLAVLAVPRFLEKKKRFLPRSWIPGIHVESGKQ